MHATAIKPSYDLQRFLDAQASTYEQARSELAAGQKRSHWMWFIFPQIHGLGSSPTAVRYAISGIHEAIAYLGHPLLGVRLSECTSLVHAVHGRTVDQIFGYPDDLKFHSSITLFAQAATHIGNQDHAKDRVFEDALRKFFSGEPDEATLRML